MIRFKAWGLPYKRGRGPSPLLTSVQTVKRGHDAGFMGRVVAVDYLNGTIDLMPEEAYRIYFGRSKLN